MPCPSNPLPCDWKCLHYSRCFSGIYFSITLHSLYRKYFSGELILLYITLSWPQSLSCTSFLSSQHYIKNSGRNSFSVHYIYGYIHNCFQNLKCNNFWSTGTYIDRNNRKGCTAKMHSQMRVRRNGAFGAHAQGFKLWKQGILIRITNRFRYISDTYQCAPGLCLEAVPEGYPSAVPPLRLFPIENSGE